MVHMKSELQRCLNTLNVTTIAVVGFRWDNLPYCLTSTQMESDEVMLASGDLMAAQVFHMLKKRKTGIAVKPKMARKARARM